MSIDERRGSDFFAQDLKQYTLHGLDSDQALEILGVSKDQSNEEIDSQYKKLYREYAAGEDGENLIAQYLDRAREILLSVAIRESDKEIVKINLESLARKGIKAFKDSAPEVLTSDFLGRCFDLENIPYFALIMKGIEKLLEEQADSDTAAHELDACLSSVDKVISSYGQTIAHVTLDGKELEKELGLKDNAPSVGDLSYRCGVPVNCFITRIAASVLKKKIEAGSFKECSSFRKFDQLVLMRNISSVYSSLSELDCTMGAESYLVKAKMQEDINNQKNIDDQESIANKEIASKLHDSFKKRTKFFKNEKDIKKDRLFEDILKKNKLTTQDIETVVTFHTGRFGGLFGCISSLFGRQPTSQKEYGQITGNVIPRHSVCRDCHR